MLANNRHGEVIAGAGRSWRGGPWPFGLCGDLSLRGFPDLPRERKIEVSPRDAFTVTR